MRGGVGGSVLDERVHNDIVIEATETSTSFPNTNSSFTNGLLICAIDAGKEGRNTDKGNGGGGEENEEGNVSNGEGGCCNSNGEGPRCKG